MGTYQSCYLLPHTPQNLKSYFQTHLPPLFVSHLLSWKLVPSLPWSLLKGWRRGLVSWGLWKLAWCWPRRRFLWMECLVWHQSLLSFWRWSASSSSLCHCCAHTQTLTHTQKHQRVTLGSHPVHGSDRQRTKRAHPYRRQSRWTYRHASPTPQTHSLHSWPPLAFL